MDVEEQQHRGEGGGGGGYPAEEDHAGTRSTQRLVCGGGDDVAVHEGLVCLVRRNKATVHGANKHQARATHHDIGDAESKMRRLK